MPNPTVTTVTGVTAPEPVDRYRLDGMLLEVSQPKNARWLWGYKAIGQHLNIDPEYVRKRLVLMDGCPIVRRGKGATVRVWSADLDRWLRQSNAA